MKKKQPKKPAKKRPTPEPVTDPELRAALKKFGYKLIAHAVNSFSVQYKETGNEADLEAEDYSRALVEAYHLVKR